MTGEQFYNEFKDALDYVGCRWGDKADATIVIDGDKVRVIYNDREAVFTVKGEA